MVRHQHGTRARYAAGCRCRRCKGAWALYIRNRRHAKGRDLETARQRLDVRRTISIVARAVETDADAELPVKLSPLGGQILVARMQRTGRSRSAVLDELLRERGGEL